MLGACDYCGANDYNANGEDFQLCLTCGCRTERNGKPVLPVVENGDDDSLWAIALLGMADDVRKASVPRFYRVVAVVRGREPECVGLQVAIRLADRTVNVGDRIGGDGERS